MKLPLRLRFEQIYDDGKVASIELRRFKENDEILYQFDVNQRGFSNDKEAIGNILKTLDDFVLSLNKQIKKEDSNEITKDKK